MESNDKSRRLLQQTNMAAPIVLFVTQKHPTSPMAWATRECGRISLTCDCFLKGLRSARGPFAVVNRRQNVCWSAQRSPVLTFVFLRLGPRIFSPREWTVVEGREGRYRTYVAVIADIRHRVCMAGAAMGAEY